MLLALHDAEDFLQIIDRSDRVNYKVLFCRYFGRSILLGLSTAGASADRVIDWGIIC